MIFLGGRTLYHLTRTHEDKVPARCVIFLAKLGPLEHSFNSSFVLTCPLSSRRLLVNFSLSNETICFIHCAPLAGESGW